jgi:hypothetical protein
VVFEVPHQVRWVAAWVQMGGGLNLLWSSLECLVRGGVELDATRMQHADKDPKPVPLLVRRYDSYYNGR